MINFTSHQAKILLIAAILLFDARSGPVSAQSDTTLGIPGATARAARAHPVNADALTNVPVAQPADIPVAPVAAPVTSPVAAPLGAPTADAPAPAVLAASPVPEFSSFPRSGPPAASRSPGSPGGLTGQLLALMAIGGFIAYYCGLTRAKNCGHTCTVLLVGVMFGLTGFWISGFAVQSGGLGDAHAALTVPLNPAAISGLDHELALPGVHHWGFMGSAAFFLSADTETRNSTATLFLGQAVLLALAVTVALGGALERVRLLALAISAFLVGALVYPLFANWVWGGGWLAELGRESGLGHGLIDLAGAGVVHLAAGTLALVFTLELGPRYGRFGRNHAATIIPGHNMPFVILGSALILLALTAVNAAAYPGSPGEEPGLAATNTLLGAAGGLLASFFFAYHKSRRLDPAWLCRGLIGGAVAVSAGGALIDPWAAFVIGVVAAGLVQLTVGLLERKRIDDPVGVVAVHGTGGAWGLLAVGIFANGSAGVGINGVAGPVRGVFSHNALQLVAQLIGCLVCFTVVFALGYGCVSLLHKIVGIRVDVADETGGLDFPKLGVLGYQADLDVEKER